MSVEEVRTRDGDSERLLRLALLFVSASQQVRAQTRLGNLLSYSVQGLDGWGYVQLQTPFSKDEVAQALEDCAVLGGLRRYTSCARAVLVEADPLQEPLFSKLPPHRCCLLLAFA